MWPIVFSLAPISRSSSGDDCYRNRYSARSSSQHAAGFDSSASAISVSSVFRRLSSMGFGVSAKCTMRPFCRCRKAFSARTATAPIPKAGNAAPTAVTTRSLPGATPRRAGSCRRRFRTSSSAPDAPGAKTSVRRRPSSGRQKSAAHSRRIGASAADGSGRSTGADRSSSNNHSSRHNRENSRVAVAGVVAVAADDRVPQVWRRRPRRRRRPTAADRHQTSRRIAKVVGGVAAGGASADIAAAATGTHRRNRRRRPKSSSARAPLPQAAARRDALQSEDAPHIQRTLRNECSSRPCDPA